MVAIYLISLNTIRCLVFLVCRSYAGSTVIRSYNPHLPNHFPTFILARPLFLVNASIHLSGCNFFHLFCFSDGLLALDSIA